MSTERELAWKKLSFCVKQERGKTKRTLQPNTEVFRLFRLIKRKVTYFLSGCPVWRPISVGLSSGDPLEAAGTGFLNRFFNPNRVG